MAQQVVTELVIDARSAAAGAAAYDAAMKKAESAAARVIAVNDNAQAAIERSTVSMTQSSGRQAAAWNRMAAGADAVTAARLQLEKAQRSGAAIMALDASRADEVASTLAVYRSRLDAAATASHRGTAATALNAGQVQNLTFQLNDMATMLASGQSPFVMLMQQGMQMAQVFGPGVGVGGALKATGAALMSFITNPLTLAVIGIAAAAGGVKLLFDTISGGGANAEETLKRQADLIGRMKDRFGEVDGAAKRYQETLASMQFAQRGVAEDLAKTLKAQLQPLRNLDLGVGSGAGRQYADDQMEAMFQATAKFVDAIRAGKGDVLAFNEQVAEIANSDPADKALQKYARRLAEATGEAAKTAQAIRELNRSMLENMDVAGRLASSSALAQQDMANYAKFVNEQRVSIDRLNEAHAAEVAAIGAKSPAQKAAAAAEAERISLLGQEITAEERATRVAQAGALARAQAEYELSDATRERLRGMQETIDAAQLEIRAVGQSVGETAKLRAEFEMLQAAKRAAIESGTIVSDAEVAAIKEAASALGDLNQQLAETKVLSDLQFDQSQIFRSGTEQKVASTLRDLYGEDWQRNADGAIAKQIRINSLLGEAGKAAADVGSTLVDGLLKGEGIVKSIGGALSSAVGGLSGSLGGMAGGFITKITGGGFLSGILGSLGGGLVSSLVSGLGGLIDSIFGGNDAEREAEREQRRAERRLKAQERRDKIDAKREKLEQQEERRLAKQEARARRMEGYADRATVAGLDTTTLDGQLAQFDLEAQREREQVLRDGGKKANKELAALDKALAAERLQIQRDFNDDMVAEAKAAQDELNRVGKSIVEYIASLNSGSNSPLSPSDRLAAAQSTYASQLALAQGGNIDAQGSITSYADDLISAAREMFASSTAFFDIFNQVKADLLGLPAVAESTDPVVQALAVAQAAITGSVDLMRTTLVNSLSTGFDSIDIDASGGITLAEMQTALGTTNTALTDIFNKLDTNGNGQIEKLELIRAQAALTATNTAGTAKDVTLGGLLTKTQLQSLGLSTDTKLGTLLTSAQLAALGLSKDASVASLLTKAQVQSLGLSTDTKLSTLLTSSQMKSLGLASNATLGTLLTKAQLSALGLASNATLATLNGTDGGSGIRGINNQLRSATSGMPVLAKDTSLTNTTSNLGKVAGNTTGAAKDASLKAKSGETLATTLITVGSLLQTAAQNEFDLTIAITGQLIPAINGIGYASGGMIPRFAAGGTVGNGAYNVDSVRARYAGGGDIMLAGGEFVTRATSVNAMTMPILDAINRTGRPASAASFVANDNGRYFEIQNRLMMSGFAAVVASNERLEARMARVEAATVGVSRAVERKPVAKPQTKVA